MEGAGSELGAGAGDDEVSRSVDMDLAALVPRDSGNQPAQRPPDGLESRQLAAAESQPGTRIQPSRGAGGVSGEPKVKSLTVNLNTVVSQRTLISLLTGLDLLEDLQLNYMQLNLTNFEPDLEADPTNSATTATEELDLRAASAPVAPTTRILSPSQAPTTSANNEPPQVPTTSTTTTTTTTSPSTTSTTTTTAPQTTQMLASQTPPLAPTTSAVTSTPRLSQTNTMTTPPTTTTTASAPNKPKQKLQQIKPISWTTTTTNAATLATSSPRPLISLGSPRGLLHAQATGIPTTVVNITSAPPPTTTLLSSTTTTTTTTTTPAPVTTVPSVSLSTAAASVRLMSSPSPTMATSREPPVRVPQVTGPSVVSVVPAQPVHYTSAPTTNPTPPRPSAGMFHLTSGSNQPIVSTSVSHSVSSSSHISPPQPTILAQNGNYAPSSSRMHQTSSGWQFHAPPTVTTSGTSATYQPTTPVNPPAGTRLSLSGHHSSNQMDFTHSNTLQPTGSSSGWNTPATSSSASSSSTSTSAAPTDQSLSAPANTPAYAHSMHSNGFGIRTGGSPVPLSFGLSQNQNSNQQGFRPTTTNLGAQTGFRTFAGTMGARRSQVGTTTSADQDTNNPFVAAGGRLYNSNSNQQPTTTSSAGRRQSNTNSFAPSTLAFVDDLTRSPASSSASVNVRRKRFISGSSEEFELSFGEILPNLRSLKLESFIDLSAHVTHQHKPKAAHRRLKRQFQPGDAPEKDDSHMSGSESDGLSGDSDTLIAEETSVHHNSVMATENRPSAANNKRARSQGISSSASSQRGSPRDPLWQSASDPAPSVHLVERDSPSGSDWTSDQDLGESANKNNDQQLDLATDARLRHLSLLLVKLFSRLNKLKVLQLSSNDIPYWPDNVLFDSRNSLTRLYLISNNIRQLSKNALANLTELHTMDVSSNQLRQLSGDTFRDLARLRNVRACRNLFRKLPAKLFARMYQSSASSNNNSASPAGGQSKLAANRLESVDFSKNRYLSQLSADLFALPSSQQSPFLDASHSPISSLNLSDCSFNDQMAGKTPEILFATMPDLISISLNGNKLREFLMTNSLFGKNNRLQRLDLSHNQLTTMSANLFNANASQITELQLHHNQLAQIPEQFLFNLRKLRKLSLAHNRLTQLNPRMFFTNQFIEQIDLSHNQLLTLNTQQSGMIPFGNGANLRYLNLAHNNMSHFEVDLFEIAWSFYTNLNYLDLSHNQFSGQIAIPIFYTITDELALNLGSNRIQSVNVEALIQHEQILDSFETENPQPANLAAEAHLESASASANAQHHKQQSKVPTVNIKLTNNPISCDCMLEPLVSYTRRVAAATNPSLVASIFATSPSAQSAPRSGAQNEDSLSASSRYSVLDNRHESLPSGHHVDAAKQPQVFYQFKFNDLYCARPANLQRRLLSHISIGDLLCPIRDERLCPSQCQCHYQSAFKTVIVDCNNRQLVRVPDQLTDASNFVQFDLESAFSSLTGNHSRRVPSVDKVIIRLDNNQLRSMDQLVRLFTIVSNSTAGAESRNRFARARGSSSATFESRSTPEMAPGEPLTSASAQPLTTAEFTPALGKKVISPVIIARNLNGNARQRSKRQLSGNDFSAAGTTTSFPAEFGADGAGFDSVVANHLGADQDLGANPTATATALPLGNQETPLMSTAVLESAEEFRSKRYPLTCELYLDHNLIETIPAGFLEMLDQLKSSSMQSALIPPQAALPTLMLEPPVHVKLNNIANAPDPDPMRASGSVSNSAISDPQPAEVSDQPDRLLFGRQPLAPEKKAALMETINQNVRMNQLRSQKQLKQGEPTRESGGKFSVSPSLVVLSLRYNNLANIEAKILQRLSKLIKSSNTKLYLGHNPFNCSDNYAPVNASSLGERIPSDNDMLPGSPMGDHMVAASDSSSGAYLENADDLSQSASSDDATVSGQNGQHGLAPVDCPVGQLKTWLTRHHSSIGDLDELYCVRMSPELAEKLRLAANSSSSAQGSERLGAGSSNKWDHDHPWASSVPMSAMAPATRSAGSSLVSAVNGTKVSKNGLTWDSELLSATAKLIDVDLYELCPYSGNQLLDASAVGLLSAGHQQALMSVAVVFILISLCLLLMLVYFGDTQTILAFVYIHMNPIYSCLRLNESHLDGDKLYDAFVSYSSADRDIVMELIEKLELHDPSANGASDQRLGGKLSSGRNLDKSHDTLVSEADLRPEMNQNGNVNGQNSNTLNRRTNSFQDLSTMSRSTSRIMMNLGDDLGGSAIDMNSSGASNGRLSPSSDSSEGRVPYRLCIHERDWLPGHLISWNIVNSVQNSRRTILVLSKDFIKSVWFQVEFHTAYYQMLEDKIDRLIVIVRGELPPKHELDKNLAFLLTTKTYLTWGEKWFWERLHYALPHRSIPPAVSSGKRRSKLASKPVKQHHHQYTPKKSNASGGPAKSKANEDMMARQKPLIMSNIGKDCSNLLLPPGANGHSAAHATVGSASSSGSSASNTRSSASSFLSAGSSTGNLFSTTATTNNDLLSKTTAATKLTIGPSEPSSRQNLGSQLDSGRATGDSSASSVGREAAGSAQAHTHTQARHQQATGITSIMLDGNPNLSADGYQQSGAASSRVKARKQEKLQNFVDKSISEHFNLSEL